jgi:hypothetical protein
MHTRCKQTFVIALPVRHIACSKNLLMLHDRTGPDDTNNTLSEACVLDTAYPKLLSHGQSNYKLADILGFAPGVSLQ